jgi:glycosyltransferase involved in cell wall biosynthesis
MAGGGAERQLSLLARELCRSGVDIHVAFVHAGVNLEAVQGSGATLHRIRSWGNHDPAIFIQVLALIRLVRPEIVHTWLRQMDILGGLAAKISGVPHVLSERSSHLAYEHSWKDWIRGRVGRGATAIVANSKGGIDYWTAQGRSYGLYLIRNGMPLDRIRETTLVETSKLGMGAEVELVVFAGRLSPEKNVHVIMDALDRVMELRPKLTALMFGEGPLRREIEQRIERFRYRERYRLMGFSQELWSWMRVAKLVVSIGQFEGNPNVVLEAMVIGCPLVISDIPSHREILDDSTATFCNGGSASEVGTAINEVLSNPVLAKMRADAARQRAETGSIEKAAREHLHLYEVLASRRRMSQ